MPRKPNAGGGRHNKSSRGPTRARFSNWKPPSKNVRDKFSTRRRPGSNDQKRADIGRPVESPQLRIISKTEPEHRDVFEHVAIPESVLRKLFSIFGFDRSNGKNLALHKTQSASITSSDSVSVQVAPPPFELSKPVKRHPELSNIDMTAQHRHDLYRIRGFDSEEIFACTDALKSSNVDDNEFFATLLFTAMQHKVPSRSGVSSHEQVQESILFNKDMMEEVEVLEAIYNTSATSSNDVVPSLQCQHLVLFGGTACMRIDLKCIVDYSCNKQVRTHLVIFIVRADVYPAEGSMLYAWLLPHTEQCDMITKSWSIQKSSTGIVSEAGVIESLPINLCRKLSLRIMRDVQAQLRANQLPAIFDLVQMFSESIASCAELTAPAPSVGASSSGPSCPDQKKAGAAKPPKVKTTGESKGNDKSAVSSTSDKADDDSSIPEKKTPPPLVKPLTNHMACPEYRQAFNGALMAGLSGAAARAHAREALEYVLPTSVMKALEAEEAYAEDLAARAFSVTEMGTKEIIEGTRILAERMHINKTQAKSLFAAGKEALFNAGDWFARDAVALREKCIRSAIATHQAAQERRDVKRQQKREEREARIVGTGGESGKEDTEHSNGRRRRKHRGPTLRDAYDIAGHRKIRINVDTGEEEYDDNDDDDVEKGEGEEEEQEQSAEEARAVGTTGDVDKYDNEDEEALPSEYELQQEEERLKRETQRKQLQSRQMRNAQVAKEKNAKYKEMLGRRSNLPAFKMKDVILRTIAGNSVVVVSGDTGCGKTTQIPQMVLDEWIEQGRGAECNILVTQPRRISAVSVAEHIARERTEAVGQSTGYHIRLEAKKGPNTRLLLMTTGVLLRRLQIESDLDNVSHVFVDEVHERDVNTDFLLIVLKQLLQRRPDLKIVLMSATLNADLFLDYFRTSRREFGYGPCSLISIPGRAFPVETFYLEDVLQQTGFEISADAGASMTSRSGERRGGREVAPQQEALRKERLSHIQQLRSTGKYSDRVIMSLKQMDESQINLEMIRALVLHIMKTSDATSTGQEGAILIFVAGLSDIRDVIECLQSCVQLRGKKAPKILPLHSSLSSHEQNVVFQVPPPGVQKIIVSTNIAETSVTIEDVVYVIDTCRVKETRYDEDCHMNVLEEQWISQANARQRRGRAGRVRSGVCYHLATRFTVDGLRDFSVPEMLRMSLEDIVLQVLALDLGDPYDFLRNAISPPEHQSISQAVLYLESLNAVSILNVDTSSPETMMALNNTTDTDFDLASEITPLGYHLAALPISPRIGKLILYGVLLKCIDPILTIASTVSARSPFVVPFGEREAADAAKLSFLDGNSDLLSMLNVYQIWKDQFGGVVGGSGRGRRGGGNVISAGPTERDEEEFCRSNFLSSSALRLIDQMRGQFLGLLQSIGFMPQEVTIDSIKNCEENLHGSNTGVVKCAICAGLSPSVLMIQPTNGRACSFPLSKSLQETVLLSRRRGMPMYVHPSSVLSNCSVLDSSYMVYMEGMKTSKMYARDVTTLLPLTLALFSGRLTCNERLGIVAVDGWIRFSASSDTIKCMMKVQEVIEDAFIAKVLDPSAPSSDLWNRVFFTILGCIL